MVWIKSFPSFLSVALPKLNNLHLPNDLLIGGICGLLEFMLFCVITCLYERFSSIYLHACARVYVFVRLYKFTCFQKQNAFIIFSDSDITITIFPLFAELTIRFLFSLHFTNTNSIGYRWTAKVFFYYVKLFLFLPYCVFWYLRTKTDWNGTNQPFFFFFS